ncbi:MAG TPA: hypothetical protein VN436_13665 [Holophaga sp.]|nr:hypothetical protein [Holophaga sp.]
MNEWIRLFEMSVSREEFLRLLPAALGGESFEEAGNRFLHQEPERHWSLTLSPLPDLDLGSLHLARHAVVWRFAGYSLTEIDALVGRFERHFQRGGG